MHFYSILFSFKFGQNSFLCKFNYMWKSCGTLWILGYFIFPNVWVWSTKQDQQIGTVERLVGVGMWNKMVSKCNFKIESFNNQIEWKNYTWKHCKCGSQKNNRCGNTALIEIKGAFFAEGKINETWVRERGRSVSVTPDEWELVSLKPEEKFEMKITTFDFTFTKIAWK